MHHRLIVRYLDYKSVLSDCVTECRKMHHIDSLELLLLSKAVCFSLERERPNFDRSILTSTMYVVSAKMHGSTHISVMHETNSKRI